MNYQEELQVINQAIAKFKAIPLLKFCTNLLHDSVGRACFLGHYGIYNPWDIIYPSKELIDISTLANKYLNPTCDTYNTMAIINNGNDPRYKQFFVKDRIMAALYDIKAMILTQNPPVDDVINQITSHQESSPVLQDKLSMTV